MVIAIADLRSSNHHQRLRSEAVCITSTLSKYRPNKVSFKIVDSCNRGDVLLISSHVLDGLLNCNCSPFASYFEISYLFRSSEDTFTY